MKRALRSIVIVALLMNARPASTQTLSGDALINALRRGGYVLVMRHASSPREAPPRQLANADNINAERQLDETGRATAIAMGNAIRELKIPIGEVLSSPTYRALETARLARLANPRTAAELGDGGQSMQGAAQSQTAWLQARAARRPAGTNTILITHLPNMTAAFPQWVSGLADGETLVLGAGASGAVTLVARIKIEQWPGLR